MGNFIEHAPCPECGSNDNLSVYDDGVYCQTPGCGYKKRGDKIVPDKIKIKTDFTRLPQQKQPGLPERGISATAVERYKVTTGNQEKGHVYPYFDEDGSHVGNKIRRGGEKSFYFEGDYDGATLFGQQAFPRGGRSITIVEGELDALSTFELTGSRYPVVSVKSASTALADAKASYEYLDSFASIVICFDSDEPGQSAAERVAAIFAIGKVRLLKLQKGKDANDYLRNKLGKEFVDEWFRAATWSPAGIKLGRDMWDEIVNRPNHFTVPYPIEGLNRTTYGLRLSELVVITAETGVGKTSILKEIEYSLLTNPEVIERGYGVGFLHFEEPNHDTVLGLMSIHADKPFHLPDTAKTEEELREAYEAVIDNDRVVIWDHFGSNNVDEVLAKIRHMAALGCKYIVVDHLSIVVSDQSGDERKQLDEISTKLKMMAMESSLAIIAVIHQNRAGQIRGTAGVEQLANIVFKLHREVNDDNEWRRNVTEIVCQKNRFCGRTGPSAYVFYNEITGRLEPLSPELVTAYKDGGTNVGLEF